PNYLSRCDYTRSLPPIGFGMIGNLCGIVKFFSEAPMAKTHASRIAEVVREHEQEVLSDWIDRQKNSVNSRRDLINESELQRQSREFLSAFVAGCEGSVDDIHAPSWTPALELLSRISESRAIQGFSPSETATFVFSLKQPLFSQLRKRVSDIG